VSDFTNVLLEVQKFPKAVIAAKGQLHIKPHGLRMGCHVNTKANIPKCLAI